MSYQIVIWSADYATRQEAEQDGATITQVLPDDKEKREWFVLGYLFGLDNASNKLLGESGLLKREVIETP